MGDDRQIVRDWVLRFNAQGPAGLIDRHGEGLPAASRLPSWRLWRSGLKKAPFLLRMVWYTGDCVICARRSSEPVHFPDETP